MKNINRLNFFEIYDIYRISVFFRYLVLLVSVNIPIYYLRISNYFIFFLKSKIEFINKKCIHFNFYLFFFSLFFFPPRKIKNVFILFIRYNKLPLFIFSFFFITLVNMKVINDNCYLNQDPGKYN